MFPDTSRPSEAPSLDPTIVETLRDAVADDELVAEIIDTFLDETPAHLAELSRAASSGDVAAAGAAAHLVKGSALTLGALRLGRLCAALEVTPEASLAQEALAEFERASERLRDLLAGLRP